MTALFFVQRCLPQSAYFITTVADYFDSSFRTYHHAFAQAPKSYTNERSKLCSRTASYPLWYVSRTSTVLCFTGSSKKVKIVLSSENENALFSCGVKAMELSREGTQTRAATLNGRLSLGGYEHLSSSSFLPKACYSKESL